MRWAASFSPWKMNYIGDWGQPAGQNMIEFLRIEEDIAGPHRSFIGDFEFEHRPRRQRSVRDADQSRGSRAP
jgi:hypothetical protein